MDNLLKLAAVAVIAMGINVNPAQAAGGLSCSDLNDGIDALADVLDELEDRASVIADSAYDRYLRDAAEFAIDFADAEGDSRLPGYARGMLQGWENEDSVRYIANGDAMLKIYKRLYDRDC